MITIHEKKGLERGVLCISVSRLCKHHEAEDPCRLWKLVWLTCTCIVSTLPLVPPSTSAGASYKVHAVVTPNTASYIVHTWRSPRAEHAILTGFDMVSQLRPSRVTSVLRM